jgi:hypothetical protein
LGHSRFGAEIVATLVGERMVDQLVQLTLDPGPGAGASVEELEELTAHLRRELLELDVHSVERVRTDEAPAGTRAVDMMALGALVVSLTNSPDLLKALVGTVQAWVARDQDRSIKLELDGDTLEVTGLSSGEQQRLVEQWIARHSK